MATAVGEGMTSYDDSVRSLQRQHWPYADERCRKMLDVDSVEGQAIHILSRGMRSQRLLAFVGAGVSMAYGRMTWSSFTRHLYEETAARIERLSADNPTHVACQVWERTCKQMWKDGAAFESAGDHPAKAQTLAIVRQLLNDPQLPQDPPLASIHDDTTDLLKDTTGFAKHLLGSVYGQAGQIAYAKAERGKSSGQGLRAVLAALQNSDAMAAATMVKTALHLPSRERDSPLRLLTLEWGIRRFLTTNYDGEIERALKELLYQSRERPGDRDEAVGTGVVHANQLVVRTFDARETGRAVAFAVEGPRRHSAVMHLHGRASEEPGMAGKSLVVTDADYQRLYVEDHPARDLVTNASTANFAANPVLFLGSDMGEADVMRPMRQFITGQGHRRDRMAVALFAATKERDARVSRQVNLLQSYGIYAIFYGHADTEANAKSDDPTSTPGDGGPTELWLARLWLAWEAFEKAAAGGRDRPELIAKAKQQLAELPEPVRIEGQAFDQVNDFRPELDRLKTAVRDMKASSIDAKLRAQFQVTRDWITSLFLCAKLVWLHRKAVDSINADARPLPPYVRPRNPLARMVQMQSWTHLHQRHRVLAGYPGFVGRFESPVGLLMQAGSAPRHADDGLRALCDDIRSAKDFRGFGGRRLVVVCAARGLGKGAQSDRLMAPKSGAAAGPTGHGCQGLYLEDLLAALSGYPSAELPSYGHVLHVNLSFSNEVGAIISQLAALLHDIHDVRFHSGMRGRDAQWSAPCSDQLEELARGLASLGLPGPKVRLLVVLGNAGVLFDAEGRPKNGQIARTLRMLLSRRFLHIPLDLLMYVGESQVPKGLRVSRAGDATEHSEELGLSADEAREAVRQSENDRVVSDQRRRRRLNRLNIRVVRDKATLFVHPLARTRLTHLAASLFPGLAEALGWVQWPAPPTVAGGIAPPAEGLSGVLAARGSREDILARHLHQAVGGSRFALTLLLAWLDAQRATPSDQIDSDDERARLARLCDEVLAAFDGPPSGSMVETTIEFVLDRWAGMHALGSPMHPSACPQPKPHEDGLHPLQTASTKTLLEVMQHLTSKPSAASWGLATELLWHLAAFSHPVEASVLYACRGVRRAAGVLAASITESSAFLKGGGKSTAMSNPSWLIRAMLELLAHWCLAFRIGERPLNQQLSLALLDRGERVRYAPHRHMARHWIRLMGGRNVETTHWDQFTTTMYASLPDEAPVLRQAAHRELTGVLKTLTGYPVPPGDPAFADTNASESGTSEGDIESMVQQADRIRAAYYLVRTTYSLGVVAHLAPQDPDAGAHCGHMEQYRRLVRWITHAARYWDRRFGVSTPNALLAEQPDGGQSISPGQAWNGVGAARHSGIFYPGELTWLYAESGVISLAQGKLQDAEHLLTLAEATCRMVEADDAGSLHARVRLHTAYVQFERGRPDRARHILTPIANRSNGHPVPPLIASYYLGLIEHIGGNYLNARARYDTAFTGLAFHRRARATAFVLVNLADLIRVTEPTHFKEAVAKSDLAISLAQQGGHEDLRVLATLGKIRLHVEAGSHIMTELFEELHHAERYAARMDNPRIANEVHDLRARYLYQQGEYRLSAQDATQGLEIAALYDMKLRKARGLLTLARVMWKRGELSSADSLVKMGRELAASCDYYTCVRGFKELELMLQRTVGPREMR